MTRRLAARVLTVLALVGSAAFAPAVAARASTANLSPFTKLGSWVDLYDYQLNAWQSTGVMQQNGVHTVYLETGRWNTPNTSNTAEFADRKTVDWWIHSAHARGMKIVGWYLPAYDDMNRDVRRTDMIWTYRTGYHQHFDGVGIDIEYKSQMPSLTAWDKAVFAHIKRVRETLGSGAPVAAIVPAPLGMDIRPQDWKGFPWGGLGTYANVFMPMGYWSYRTDCSSNPDHCAYGYTKGNILETRRRSGKPNVPVHVIGGIGNKVDDSQVADYVKAMKDFGGTGGSLYDYNTTKSSYWASLDKLNG